MYTPIPYSEYEEYWLQLKKTRKEPNRNVIDASQHLQEALGLEPDVTLPPLELRPWRLAQPPQAADRNTAWLGVVEHVASDKTSGDQYEYEVGWADEGSTMLEEPQECESDTESCDPDGLNDQFGNRHEIYDDDGQACALVDPEHNGRPLCDEGQDTSDLFGVGSCMECSHSSHGGHCFDQDNGELILTIPLSDGSCQESLHEERRSGGALSSHLSLRMSPAISRIPCPIYQTPKKMEHSAAHSASNRGTPARVDAMLGTTPMDPTMLLGSFDKMGKPEAMGLAGTLAESDSASESFDVLQSRRVTGHDTFDLSGRSSTLVSITEGSSKHFVEVTEEEFVTSGWKSTPVFSNVEEHPAAGVLLPPINTKTTTAIDVSKTESDGSEYLQQKRSLDCRTVQLTKKPRIIITSPTPASNPLILYVCPSALDNEVLLPQLIHREPDVTLPTHHTQTSVSDLPPISPPPDFQSPPHTMNPLKTPSYWDSNLSQYVRDWLELKETASRQTRLGSLSLGVSQYLYCSAHHSVLSDATVGRNADSIKLTAFHLPPGSQPPLSLPTPLDWIVLEINWSSDVLQSHPYTLLAFPRRSISNLRVRQNSQLSAAPYISEASDSQSGCETSTLFGFCSGGSVPAAHGRGFDMWYLQEFMEACARGEAVIEMRSEDVVSFNAETEIQESMSIEEP